MVRRKKGKVPVSQKHTIHRVKIKGKMCNLAVPDSYPKEKIPHLVKYIEDFPEKESPPPEAMVTKPKK